MDKNPCRVTVKRIEKIPSRYYVQVKTPVAKARTKVKVEVSDSLLAESKRLTDALRARIGADEIDNVRLSFRYSLYAGRKYETHAVFGRCILHRGRHGRADFGCNL